VYKGGIWGTPGVRGIALGATRPIRCLCWVYVQHTYVSTIMSTCRWKILCLAAVQVSELHRQLAPHMLRRLKKDVLKQLPPKMEQMVRHRTQASGQHNLASMCDGFP
jgi:hypothetical protein